MLSDEELREIKFFLERLVVNNELCISESDAQELYAHCDDLLTEVKRLREAREALEWIAQQFCTIYDDSDCLQTDHCVTEYCLPCYARAVLRGNTEEEEEEN